MPLVPGTLEWALSKGKRPGPPGSLKVGEAIEEARDKILVERFGRDEFEDKIVGRENHEAKKQEDLFEEARTMPRRKVDVGSTEVLDEPVFTWAFASSQPRGGQVINYEARLRSDGTLTCNCPGWVFKRKGTDNRECKHTRRVQDDAKVIMKQFKAGETLPVLDSVGEASTGATGAGVALTKAAAPKVRHGRLIEL